MCSLDVVAVHEHDVVPVGSVHIQIDLSDVRGQSSGSGLQLLNTTTQRENKQSVERCMF